MIIKRSLIILWRLVDFSFSATLFSFFVFLALLRRLFGKIHLKRTKINILSLTKDGILKILECNGPKYFEWDFTRPHADCTYVLFTGNEEPNIFKLSSKIIGLNIHMIMDQYKKFFPYTVTCIQEIYGVIITIKIVKKTSPKMIEVMSPSQLSFRAIFLKLLINIKLVAQVRGNVDLIYYFGSFPCFWPFQIKNKSLEWLQVLYDKFISLLFYRSCDLVIGYNINNMLSAISNGSHPSKTKLSRIKVELSMLDVVFNDRKHLGFLPQSGQIISIWSRLSPEKLVIEAIQAFEKFLDLRSSDAHLVITGDGPEENRIKSYLSKSKHKDRIHLMGYKNREFITQVALHSAASIVPYGGSSLVEAVMLEVPVIAFDIEWHNELIRDGETGYMADFPDISHMAQKIEEVLSDSKEARKRARAAKQLAVKMFDIKSIDEKEARYLAKILDADPDNQHFSRKK